MMWHSGGGFGSINYAPRMAISGVRASMTRPDPRLSTFCWGCGCDAGAIVLLAINPQALSLVLVLVSGGLYPQSVHLCTSPALNLVAKGLKSSDHQVFQSSVHQVFFVSCVWTSSYKFSPQASPQALSFMTSSLEFFSFKFQVLFLSNCVFFSRCSSPPSRASTQFHPSRFALLVQGLCPLVPAARRNPSSYLGT